MTLLLSARPNRIVEHRPRECCHCHCALVESQLLSHQRQQVWKVVPVKLELTEHQIALLRCPWCGQATQGEFSGAVRLGVQY